MPNANDTIVAAEVAQAVAAGAPPMQTPAPAFASVERWDSQRPSSLSEEKIHSVAGFHSTFARGLARCLSLSLGVAVEIELAVGRLCPYQDFVAAAGPGSVRIAIRVESQPLPVILHLDSPLAAAVLDLSLGGSGEKVPARTEFTDLDLKMLTEAGRMAAKELQAAWRDLGVRLLPEVTIDKDKRSRLPGATSVLALTFSMRMGGASGSMSLLLSVSVTERILHAVAASSEPPQLAFASTIGAECSAALLGIAVDVSLELPALRVTVGDLAGLAKDSVLRLPMAANRPAKVLVAGLEAFTAFPVRSGHWRAAKLEVGLMTGKEIQKRHE